MQWSMELTISDLNKVILNKHPDQATNHDILDQHKIVGEAVLRQMSKPQLEIRLLE
jgi:hypothetical protein